MLSFQDSGSRGLTEIALFHRDKLVKVHSLQVPARQWKRQEDNGFLAAWRIPGKVFRSINGEVQGWRGCQRLAMRTWSWRVWLV